MSANNIIDICEYIQNFDIEACNDTDHVIVDKLCKKIDVAKIVKRFYESDMSKSSGDELAQNDDLEMLTKSLVLYFQKYKDYKVLNTLLKISDNILQKNNGFEIPKPLQLQIKTLVND